MNKFNQLAGEGQAIWLDYISRSLISSGELEKLVQGGLRGMTSNPAIFEKAIAGSTDYDQVMRALVEDGASVEGIYESLAKEDIRRAADILRSVYDRSNGLDGYVSLEVNPELADDTVRTISEAERLFKELGRPNVMIKIPATRAGIPAIETAISKGINVNVTLIFSQGQYEQAALAYINGLEKLFASGGDLSRIASVASMFVSRVDTAVDNQLNQVGADHLMGKIAIANAKIIYTRFQNLFSGERWKTLQANGARVQRPLWASTGTKNPAYSDTLYVDNLIGPQTVNTLPPATLQAFSDHGTIAPTLTANVDESRSLLEDLYSLGIDLEQITQKLQVDGVAAFAEAFHSLKRSIDGKRRRFLNELEMMQISIGAYNQIIASALTEMENDQVMDRIWSMDHTLWNPDPDEISNRLGWLHIAENIKPELQRLAILADNVRSEGYTRAVLLGMGGSSLAPEVFLKTFGVRRGYPDLVVLDSTDPGAVRKIEDRLDYSQTLFIVSTKSGGTVETLSLFKYFYNQILNAVGKGDAGNHFIAITDAGSYLSELAERYNFRDLYLNDPNIGGRYSALSFFGLVPASLIGLDLQLLLEQSLKMTRYGESSKTLEVDGDYLSAHLGAVIGELARAGRDKLTLLISPELNIFGDWIEQLVAESTGKQGRGILPVVGEPVGGPQVYGDDRLFVQIKFNGSNTYDEKTKALQIAGFPVVRLFVQDNYALGEQFFLWEMAVAVAGYRLGINPFDQPNVEAAKALARQMVTAYQEKGQLPEEPPILRENGVSVYGDLRVSHLDQVLPTFLSSADKGAYICLQAYVPPNTETDEAIQNLREKLRDSTKLAVTSGYGPRFLHSTGQLHKGDSGKGLFIQFTSENEVDIPIPDEAGAEKSSISFGVLEKAQVLGDARALKEKGRKVIRFHFENDIPGRIARITLG
jgi:transaldolase/glucose-6-phosphate isomerase